VRPDLKRPEKLGASISKLEIEQGVSYTQYSSDVYGPAAIPPASLVKLTGYVVYTTISLEGFQRRQYLIDPRLYNAQTRHRVSFHPPSGYGYTQAFSPAASADKIAVRAWNPTPGKGKYFVRIMLYDLGPKEEQKAGSTSSFILLDFADSKPFTIK
jgi:hypothetical protein